MMHHCTQCGVEKPASEFYADRRNVRKLVMSRCKACIKTNTKNYKKTIGYTEADKLRARKWAQENAEKVRLQAKARRERNREGARAAVRRWFRNNPEQRAIYRRHLRQATPKWANLPMMKVVYQKARALGFEVDHIVPLLSKTVCGLHCWNNLQPLDKTLNGRKSNREWPDMPEHSRALSDAKLIEMTT